jgi:chemotaxis protein MotB
MRLFDPAPSRFAVAVSAVAALLSLGGLGCGVSKELYNARVNELGKMKSDLDVCSAKRSKLDSDLGSCQKAGTRMKDRLQALGQDVTRLQSERGSLASDLAQAKSAMEEVQRARAAAEKRVAQFRELLSKFKAMIDAGKLQVEVRDGRMLVKMSNQILFDSGRVDLKDAGKDALREVAGVLKGIGGRSFQVAGHTDNVPIRSARFHSNWELSTARAVQVVKLLIDNGMDPRRLSAAGYADQQPVAANDNEDGRAQNRRTEIVLLPNVEDLPPLEEALKSEGVPTSSGGAAPPK